MMYAPWPVQERRRVLLVMGDDLDVGSWSLMMGVPPDTILADLAWVNRR